MKSIYDPIMEYNKADGVLSDVWWVTPLLNLKTSNSDCMMPADVLRLYTYRVWFLSMENESGPLAEMIERKCPGTWDCTMVYNSNFLRIVNELDQELMEIANAISDNLKAAKWVAQTLKASTFESEKAMADNTISSLLDGALRSLEKMYRHKPKARMLSRLKREIARSVPQATVDATVDPIERFRNHLRAVSKKSGAIFFTKWTLEMSRLQPADKIPQTTD